MFLTPSSLPEGARAKIVAALNTCVLDGVDLYTQTKVAHWNVRGPLFAQIHELFDKLAGHVSEHVDDLAERAVTLGGRATGSARAVAHGSRLEEISHEVRRDLELTRLIAERTESFLHGLRAAREVAETEKDADTEDLLTGTIRGLEKDVWMLRATLDS
ncbi:MAG TPA: DNA starvation/stationary phase protection protein Dps [Kofleriaceae bacterium]|jgi:starvation-inducible DNA-binding protein|nr:DNA starvation/stationary phase protection protein Dps [Kofleriaceae bacterium]